MWAIGLSGFGLGYGLLWSKSTTLWLLNAFTNGGSLYFNSFSVLFTIGVLLAIITLGVYGNKRVRGYPLYLIALIFALLMSGTFFALTLLPSYSRVEYQQVFLLNPIAGEVSFVGFMMLNILIANSSSSKRFPQILICYGASLVGVAVNHLETTLNLTNLVTSSWSQIIIAPALLLSAALFHQHRNLHSNQTLNWVTPDHFVRNALKSPALRRVIIVVLLVELSNFTTGWFDMGEQTSAFTTTNLLFLGCAVIAVGTMQNTYTTSPTRILFKAVQISFALILISSATLRFDFSHTSAWIGLLGSNGLVLASFGVLAWYLNVADECAGDGQVPDYPKFFLTLLVVQSIPVPLVSIVFSRWLVGSDGADVFSVFGLLATFALLIAALAWVPRNAHNNDS